MKAVTVHEFGGPEVLRVDQLKDPVPGPHQLVVRVHAAGVNPVDTYIRAGTYASKPALPFIPGADAAGTIEAIGPNVKAVRPGDRVYVLKPAASGLPGTYAERTLCDVSHVHPLAPTLSFEQGAAIGVAYATAYRALFHRAHVQPGETVLVHGASGGVGVATVQLAASRGVTVIGTAGTAEGLDLVRDEGAQLSLNHHHPTYLDEIMQFTAGRGVDVIVEMLANVNLSRDLGLLARDGRVVIVGNRGTIDINPRELMSRDGAVLGMMLWNTPAQEMRTIQAALVAGFANGTLRPVVGRTFTLDEAAEAHRTVMSPGARGKVVLTLP